MLVTRYVLDGYHTKADISSEYFIAQYRLFQEKHYTNPSRIEINPVFFTDITASDEFKNYIDLKKKERLLLTEIGGLDIVIDPTLGYDHHRFVMEKKSLE